MVTPTICFRADATISMGTGHVMRCLTLAGELSRRGAQCVFASAPGIGELVPAALAYPIVTPDKLPFGADLVVVDHYGIGAVEEARIRSQSQAVMVIDDLPERRHHCDVLLDQTFGRVAEEYSRLVPNTCRVMVGSEHALLRPQFPAARDAALARRDGSLRRLLVSLGGTDSDNVTGAVLEAIAEARLSLAVDVVMGAKAPHLEAVKAVAATLPEANVHVGVSDMAGLMAQADLAVGAGGTSTWERCCLGLPTLMLVIADNQRDVARLVARAGAAEIVPVSGIADVLKTLTPERLAALSAASARLCDGQGARRVADQLRRLPSLKDLSP